MSTPSPSAVSHASNTAPPTLAMTRPPTVQTRPPQASGGTSSTTTSTSTTTTAQVTVSYQIGIANGMTQQQQQGFTQEYEANLKQATYQVSVDAAATAQGRRNTRQVPHTVMVTAVDTLATVPSKCPAIAGVVDDDTTVCETVDATLGLALTTPVATTTQQGTNGDATTTTTTTITTTTADALQFAVETAIMEGKLQGALDELPWMATLPQGANPIFVLTGLPVDDNNNKDGTTDNAQENTDRTTTTTTDNDGTRNISLNGSDGSSSVSGLTIVMTTLAACVFVILVFAAVVRRQRRQRQQRDGDLSLLSGSNDPQYKHVVTQRQSSALSSRRSGSFHNKNRDFVVLESDDEAVVFDDEMRVSKNDTGAMYADADVLLEAADTGADLLMDVADMDRGDGSEVEVGLMDVGGFQQTKYADIEVSTSHDQGSDQGRARRGSGNNSEDNEQNTLSALGIRVLGKQDHVDRVREQIDAGAWTAVGTTAALLTNMSDSQSVVSSRSSASRKSYEDGGEPALGAARAAELDDYVETEDWEGLAAAVSRFQAEDSAGRSKKQQGADNKRY